VKKHPGKIFVISGPSGSGKTTLVKAVLGDTLLKGKMARSVSFTTRPPRSGEKDTRDYFFISEQEFKKKLREKKILEWTNYLGYYYGTPQDFVEKQLRKSRGMIFCIDFKGTMRIRRIFPRDTVTIFILPSSIEELSKRIHKRCSKTKEEEIQKRLRLAEREVALSKKYDYRLVNEDLDKTIGELKGIILQELSN